MTGDWALSFRVSGGLGILAGVLFISEPIFGKGRTLVPVQTNHEDI
jgi:hypothetical protein